MNINKILKNTALFGCVGFATALPVFGESYSLLELPPQRSTKEAFLSYSRPLEEVDKERLQKLRELGYNETFRVISFDTICEGLGKSKEDFNGCIKDYETVLKDCVKKIPCSFCFCDTENKIHDFDSSKEAVENKKRSFLACLLLKPWWEKSKQVLALYYFLLKDKIELKFMMESGGFCYIKTVGNDRRYVIHFTGEKIFHHSLLAHEIKHALYYELGLSGEPALCSYTTKFIRDVYRLPQDFSSDPVTERTIEAIYNQCPAVAMDWDTIEEAWNELGFIEIDGVVYINELSDFVLPDPGEGGRSVISYHKPLFMRSYIYGIKERLKDFANRQNKLMTEDRGIEEKTIEFSDSDDEEKGKGEQSEKNEDVPHYLKAISAAFNISYMSGSAQVACRRSYMESVKADEEWYRKLKKMHNGTSDGKFSKK
ncbi:MAG: hypothetical protein IJ793_04395 [Opitutales bacterium]|nr:hypothetical protein [Opitutales bacterium]